MAETLTTDDTARRNGILLLLVGLAVAALTGALMKLLSSDLSPVLIGWFRFGGAFFILIPFAMARAGWRAFRPPRLHVQVLRGVLMVLGTVSFMIGVRSLPYADAIAILYIYPFLMTLMAPAVLGERVGLIGWLGVFGGFGGVLLVMRPELGNFNAGALFVVGTGFMVAAQMLLNRKLGVLSDPSVVSMWGTLIAALVLSLGLPFVWQPVSGYQLGILALMAVTSAISQTLMILGFSRAPASELAPFTYGEIVAAVMIGFVIFGTLPDAFSWAGIALITVSGVIVARAQSGRTVLRRQPKI